MDIKRLTCSSEISKLLKEKGFDEQCMMYYTEDGRGPFVNPFGGILRNSEYISQYTSAPMHQMTCAWLRDMHQIHIGIDWRYKYDTSETDDFTEVYFWDISSPTKNVDVSSNLPFDKYEECMEDALWFVLTKLI